MGDVVEIKPVQWSAMPLDDLARTANQSHERAESFARDAVGHAITAGMALLAAKQKITHGEWLPWLQGNFNGSQRSAQAYMRVAANAQRAADLESAGSIREALRELAGPKPAHVSNNSGEEHWYTPHHLVEAARRAMGGVIDLDPASCEVANGIVQAAQFFDAETDGLSQPWAGRVFLNPPYTRGLVDQFVQKFVDEPIDQGVILVNNFTDTSAGQTLLRQCSAVCFLGGRVAFINQDGEEAGKPLQGQMVGYRGKAVKRFGQNFGKYGVVLS